MTIYLSVKKLIIVFIMISYVSITFAQLKVGDKAPSLVMTGTDNSIQSLSFPLNEKMYLIHFWSSGLSKSKKFLPRATSLYQRYNSVPYRNCDGFDVITIAVQSDKSAWKSDIDQMNLTGLTNLIALRGFNDASIKQYGVTGLPYTLLVNEQGNIVLINPTMLQVEDYLDAARNFSPTYKDFRGKLLMNQILSNGIPTHGVVLLNTFMDTLQKAKTNDRGVFTFTGIKLLSDFIFRFDTSQNQIKFLKEIYVADANDVVMPPIIKTGDFWDLKVSGKDVQRFFLTERKANAIYFISKIKFKPNSAVLDPLALKELDKIYDILKKQSDLTLEVICHTDSKGDDGANLVLTQDQANAIKKYLVDKGIVDARIAPIGMGEKEILNKCKNNIPCSEAEHQANRRTEFKFYK